MEKKGKSKWQNIIRTSTTADIIRLKEYDYSQPGLYFITICTQNRSKLLGDIENSKMILNDAGMMAYRVWNEMPNDFHNIQLHEFVIMPN